MLPASLLTTFAWAPAAAPTRSTCDAGTFSRSLGNTHCPFLSKHPVVSTSEECMQACCTAGDECETWQWCEAGKACAQGFWAQPGTLWAGGDLPGWPQNATISAAEAACSASAACIGYTYKSTELHPSNTTLLKLYLKTNSSGPMGSGDSWSRHMKAAPGCFIGRLDAASCSNASDGWSSHALPPRPLGPCDLFAAAGTACVAAHSVVRALYQNYSGPLYRLVRESDKAGLDVGVHHSGFAAVEAHDAFCKGTECWILRLYDQSPQRNDLDTAPAGGACHHPLLPVNASKEKLAVGGNPVYGMFFEGSMGYRRDATSGVATGEMEETIYMVTRGDHVNGGCCFDYGNAETDNLDDGKGTMEALYFGTSKGWGHGQGPGPWVMADLENGLWAGDQKAAAAPSLTYQFVTAMAKGKKGGFALKGGDAASGAGGALQKLYEGDRPPGYATMKKQGAIILGIGGDASCGAIGTFYEGAMTASYTTDATDDAVHANILAAGYGS